MKRVSFLEFSITFALVGLVIMVGTLITQLVAAQGFNSNGWLLLGVFFVILAVLNTFFVIIQITREKRANKPDENTPTTETKSIGIRVNVSLGNEPVTIEAPDAESAIKALQVLLKGESSLKGQLTVEIKEPEASDVPETKENEE